MFPVLSCIAFLFLPVTSFCLPFCLTTNIRVHFLIFTLYDTPRALSIGVFPCSVPLVPFSFSLSLFLFISLLFLVLYRSGSMISWALIRFMCHGHESVRWLWADDCNIGLYKWVDTNSSSTRFPKADLYLCAFYLNIISRLCALIYIRKR